MKNITQKGLSIQVFENGVQKVFEREKRSNHRKAFQFGGG